MLNFGRKLKEKRSDMVGACLLAFIHFVAKNRDENVAAEYDTVMLLNLLSVIRTGQRTRTREKFLGNDKNEKIEQFFPKNPVNMFIGNLRFFSLYYR